MAELTLLSKETTALLAASREGSVEGVKKALAAGADPTKEIAGRCVLKEFVCAAINDSNDPSASAEIVRLLVETGIPITVLYMVKNYILKRQSRTDLEAKIRTCDSMLGVIVEKLDSFEKDVKFVFEDGATLEAHKDMLAGASPYFKAAVSKRWEESNPECIFKPQYSVRVMEIVLWFIYKGDLWGVDLLGVEGNFSGVEELLKDTTTLWDTLDAANHYEMHSLKIVLCFIYKGDLLGGDLLGVEGDFLGVKELLKDTTTLWDTLDAANHDILVSYFKQSLCLGNLKDYLVKGQWFDSPELKGACFDFIAYNWADIFFLWDGQDSEAFHALKEEDPELWKAILTFDPDCLKTLFEKEKQSNRTVAGYAALGFVPPTVLGCTSLFSTTSVRDKIQNSFAFDNDGSDFVVAVTDATKGVQALCFFKSNTFLNDPSKGNPKDVLYLKGFLEEAGFQSTVQLNVVHEYKDDDEAESDSESVYEDEASIYLLMKEPSYFDVLDDLLKTLAGVPEKVLEKEKVPGGPWELTITNQDRFHHWEWRPPLPAGGGAVALVAGVFSSVILTRFNIEEELQVEVGSGKGYYVFEKCEFVAGGRSFFYCAPLSSDLVFEESFPGAVAIQQVAKENPQHLQGTGQLILQYGKVSPQEFVVFQELQGQFENLKLKAGFQALTE